MTNAKKDQIQGEAKNVKGRIERQTGEWTGSRKAQVRGAIDQAEGKAQKASGKLKEKINRAGKSGSDLAA